MNSAQINELQKNLRLIRKVAGWTAEELGNKVGVTKQTISNLENNKTDMTLTQYIAIRTVIDYEIQTNTENKALQGIVEILLNPPENLPESERAEREEKAKLIAAMASGGITGLPLIAAGSALGGVILAEQIASSALTWMSKLYNKKKDIKEKGDN